MSTGDDITVLTVSRGRPQLLLRAIRSVQQQDYSGEIHHLVVVDDDPQTVAVLKKQNLSSINFKWISKLRAAATASGPHHLAALRNLAVQTAKTKWITFLDDDNEYEAHHLSKLMECAHKNACPAVHSWMQILHFDGTPYLEQRWPWCRDRAEGATRYQEFIKRGVLSAGSNVVKDSIHNLPYRCVDTSEWMIQRDLLLKNPISTLFTREDFLANKAEDDKLLLGLLAAKVPIVCNEVVSLRYYLGGYSTNHDGTHKHSETWKWEGSNLTATLRAPKAKSTRRSRCCLGGSSHGLSAMKGKAEPELLPDAVRKAMDDVYYSQFRRATTLPLHPASIAVATAQPQKVAIIVPFRDNQIQRRQEQLDIFVPFLTRQLQRLPSMDFHMFVIEQSDMQKFNRGKLLNVGFKIAKSLGYNRHIFHDVDLLPDQDLVAYYGEQQSSPLHLGARWEKYKNLGIFFGGVVGMSSDDYERVNGYPNSFWGWGGEDEELYHRVVDHGLTVYHPTAGRYTELPHKSTKELKGLVNEQRFRQIAQRVQKPTSDGLSDLQVRRIGEPQHAADHVTRYPVVL